MPEGILDWLEQAGRRPEGGLRFVDRAERATWFGWGEVRERALAVCGGLQALGGEPGDRAAPGAGCWRCGPAALPLLPPPPAASPPLSRPDRRTAARGRRWATSSGRE